MFEQCHPLSRARVCAMVTGIVLQKVNTSELSPNEALPLKTPASGVRPHEALRAALLPAAPRASRASPSRTARERCMSLSA